MLEKILVPDIGDYSNVEIIGIAVNVGDTIKPEDELITLETDKATMEIPAPRAGKVAELLVKVGDKVSKGSAILMLELTDAAAKPQAAPVANPTTTNAMPQQVSSSVAERRDGLVERRVGAPDTRENPVERRVGPAERRQVNTANLPSQHNVYAGPGVRRFARQLGVDLNQVSGSGRKSRILEDDVQDYVRDALSNGPQTSGLNITPAQEIDFTKFGAITVQPMNRIQKISGAFLHRNWVTIPHVTQFDEANISELEAFRQGQKDVAEKQGVKLTPIVFIMKAVVAALKQFPKFNASLSANGEELILKQYFHIGVAVDTPNGLVVPVIRDADKKGLFELAADLGTVSKKAREGKLSGADMQGGCFTISSLGGIGGTAFTPIINAPEVAILGVSKAQQKLIFDANLSGENKFAAQLMLPLSLSYDHRVIDGADAARFTAFLVTLLADIRRLLL
jgi:pyruvate dehydrogenase E2 component (dihydrolipoamide acetyltransferase)